MKTESITIRETTKFVLGELLVLVLMCLVFLLLGKFDVSVILGGLIGIVSAVIYFFLLCVSIGNVFFDSQNSDVDTESEQGLKQQKLKFKGSYYLRLGLLGVGLAIGLKFDCFNNFAVLIPVLLTQPILICTKAIERGIKN